MKRLLSYLEENEYILYVAAAVLLVPIYLLNLGEGAIAMDEPTRVLVALEMMFSGNYVTPTIFGDFYYNKPPLYNWILIGFFSASGDSSEWMVRLPAVLSLFLYGWSIYRIMKTHIGWKAAALTAFMFLTCGRMLILSSMIGHIDIFYSWLTFLNFMLIYHFYEKENWWMLFLCSYLITAITFMSKGLPSIVFQGITLLTIFSYRKNFWKLFSIQHIVSGLMFQALVGLYFWAYSGYNSLETYFVTLWTESSKRTMIEKSQWDTIIHIFTFPFEALMHVLPWSLLVIFCFQKAFLQKVKSTPFLTYCVWITFTNIIIYWLSPDTHTRYLFMLHPLIFMLMAVAYFEFGDQMKRGKKILEGLFLFGAVVVGVAVWAIPFLKNIKASTTLLDTVDQIEVISDLPYANLKMVVLFVLIASSVFLYVKLPKLRMIIFVLILLWVRLGFNWYILMHRAITGEISQYRAYGIEVAKITGDEPLYVMDGYTFNHDLTYYISRDRQKILPKSTTIEPNTFYICTDQQLEGKSYELFYEFETMHNRTPVNLVKFNHSSE